MDDIFFFLRTAFFWMNGTSGEITVGGVPEGYDARMILSEMHGNDSSVIHVARDDRRMAAIEDALGFFQPETPVFKFPGWDCLPYDRVSPNAEISSSRMGTLAAIVNGGTPRKFALLTTVNAASQRVPARKFLKGASFAAEKGSRIDESELRAFLMLMGFSKVPNVAEPGDYAVRGGIIDIFPPGANGPIRLDLFGNLLDDIRRFDPISQRTVERINRFELAPASEVMLHQDAIERFRDSYRREFGAGGQKDPVYEAVSDGRKMSGMEHWLPFFHERLETLFDFLPGLPVCMDDQGDEVRRKRWKEICERHENRTRAMLSETLGESAYKPLPPKKLYLDDSAWSEALSGRRLLKFHPGPQASGPCAIDAGGRPGRNFGPERKMENIHLFNLLKEYIELKLKKGPVVVSAYSRGSLERLSVLLRDEGIRNIETVSKFSEVGKPRVYLTVWALEQGFELPDMTVMSEQDVFGERLTRASRRQKKAENFLAEARSLNKGELVVHVDHGIGRFCGLEVVKAAGAAHECLKLEYAEGAKLYLPVENIELLTRYGEETGILDRLGTAAWQARKARLKKRILEMADSLLRVAAERELRKGPVVNVDSHSWEEFTARFPHVETDDQQNAVEDVLSDLGSGKPMDRLVCGDVGFGKTEVAMRAAFATAMQGMQVAVVAPTTLLSRQHYHNFSERFRGFPIEVRQLSRMVSRKDASETRKRLAEGTVDMAIGTHSLLSRGVRFKNLGLLIVDEEQHFGVAQKERLKKLRSEVHVLTLTATPIPRTLQLSLNGVRDLSIIGTPPIDRLSIRTYISEFDTATIRDALLREHYRGGQSFFVVPRISDIRHVEDFLIRHVPEVGHVVAHGQMRASELEDRMNAFCNAEYGVLLATAIVESGLDIPSANTLVVYRSDMFSLAQLYQIRGRVGRSKLRAYAYLTTRPRKKLTETAEKRLRILGSLDALGAGFNLAMHDMDIRGSGNLLGEQQSGQIREVGYELYQNMLEEAVDKIKSGETEGDFDAEDKWTPQINLGVAVLIPEYYVPDLDVRLGLYRRLSGLSEKLELESFAAELIDRFGKLPPEVSTLLRIVRIKAMCRIAGIARIDGGIKGATIQFYRDKFENLDGLLEYVSSQKGGAVFRGSKLVVHGNWKNERDRVGGSFMIARSLANVVKSGKKGTAATL